MMKRGCGLALGWLFLCGALMVGGAATARAEEAKNEAAVTSATAASATAATSEPASRIKLYGHADIGYTFNPDRPKDHINFGRLFDDKPNALLLNQIMLTLERPLDTTSKNFDWGFKLQVMYGSDAPPQSRDLTSMGALLAAIVTLYAIGRFMFDTLLESSRELLAGMGSYQVTETGVYNLMLKQMGTMALVLGPYLLTVMVAGVAINFAQGGIGFSWEKLSLKYNKLNPLSGAKRFVSKDSLVEIVKSLLKISIVGYVSYRVIRGQEGAFAYLSERDISEIFVFAGGLAFKVIVSSCEVLLVLALCDLAFVKWRYLQNLRMTKQEVKQEHKDSEGDQQIKGKIRRLQFEQSRRRLMKIIPTADVVITNPTHFAVGSQI